MAEKKKAPITQHGQAEDKKKALETALAQIEKNYGKGAIMRLGDDIPVNVAAVSTGSLSLDLALGIGGVPRGRIVVLPEDSGPYISTILPRGIPPSPSAISRLKAPVGIVSTFIWVVGSPSFITAPLPNCFSM